MEQLSILNKLISIEDTSLISFMYPNMIIKDDIFFDYENDVIYVGKFYRKLKEDLGHGTKSYVGIVNTGIFEVDFNNRENRIRALYTKWNKEPSDKVMDVLLNMSEDDFIEYFKKYWILGSHKIESAGDLSPYDLYKVFGKSKHEILKVYLELSKYYEDKYILNSVLGFLEKVARPESVSSNNGRYLTLLDNFRKFSSRSMNLKMVLYRAYTSNMDTHSKLLWIILNCGTGRIL